jgi:hypothetical protein
VYSSSVLRGAPYAFFYKISFTYQKRVNVFSKLVVWPKVSQNRVRVIL